MRAYENEKAAAGGQAAFITASNDSGKVTATRSFRQRLKAQIVTLALWGVLPFAVAGWLIRRLRLEAE